MEICKSGAESGGSQPARQAWAPLPDDGSLFDIFMRHSTCLGTDGNDGTGFVSLCLHDGRVTHAVFPAWAGFFLTHSLTHSLSLSRARAALHMFSC